MPHHLAFSQLKKSAGGSQLIKSETISLMNLRYRSVQWGWLVGYTNFYSVVPAMMRFIHGTTRVTLPSGLSEQIPNEPLPTALLYVMWLPATRQIRFFAYGLSRSRRASAHAPVQLTTYLALTLYYFLVSRSRKTAPTIFPYWSFVKSTNSALLRILAGLNDSGILMPLPKLAVSRAARSSLASLNDPSSYTTPMSKRGLRCGKMLVSSSLLRKQGMRKTVGVTGEQREQMRQYTTDPTQQYTALNTLLQGITKGSLVVRCGALSIIRLRQEIASFTNWNFYRREVRESQESSNTCCRYRTPPWISLVDLELAPDPKSYFSISRVRIPRVAASRATPAPLHPPPITSTSQVGFAAISLRWSVLFLYFTGAI